LTVQDLPAQILKLFQIGTTLLVAFVIFQGLTQFQFFANSAAFTSVGKTLTVLDYAGASVMVGLFLASFVVSTRIQATKLALPISLLFVVISSLIGAVFSNVWSGLVSGTALTTAAQSLPFMNRILLNLPVLIAVSGVLVNVALFSNIGAVTGTGRRARR